MSSCLTVRLKRLPTIGMSPMKGTLSTVVRMVCSKMPPSTIVSPLSTRTCVDTFFVSTDGMLLNSCPTASFFTSRSMTMRSSGVMYGVTASSRTAGLNATVVAPLAALVRYGISVPCEMTAFLLSAVITRGLDTTLPRLSASSAESSMLTRLPLPRLRIDNANCPAAPATGRFTLSCSGCAPIGIVPLAAVDCAKPAPDEAPPWYTSEDEPRDTGLFASGLLVSVSEPDTPTL